VLLNFAELTILGFHFKADEQTVNAAEDVRQSRLLPTSTRDPPRVDAAPSQSGQDIRG
jgi:hypothetical protein